MALHTLLLVDPSPKVQAEIRAMFADEPIAVEVAADGQQALEQIEAHRPNVVLACAKAEAVDGYAIAHFVARRPNLRAVTVLLLLARSAVDERRIHESGAKGFLTKPLRATVVVSRVREALVHSPAKQAKPAARTKPATPPKPAVRPKRSAAPKAAAAPKTIAPPKVVAPPTVTEPPKPAVVAESRGELDSAFDVIDAGMKAPPRAAPDDAFLIMPATLAKIVQDAVDKAIESYQRTHGPTPSPRLETAAVVPARSPAHDAAPKHPGDGQIKRLQHEMGLDDLNLDQPPAPDESASAPPASAAAPPAAPPDPDSGLHRLQHEMGLDDLDLSSGPAAAPLDGRAAKPNLADVSLEDATAAAFALDRPDESLEWLQEQLHIPTEPDEEDDQADDQQAAAGHAQAVEPVRQAVEAVRARLSTLMHHKAIHPAPRQPEPAPSAPHEQAPQPDPRPAPAARPPAAKDPDDIRFTFDPLPPLPPSLLKNPDKE